MCLGDQKSYTFAICFLFLGVYAIIFHTNNNYQDYFRKTTQISDSQPLDKQEVVIYVDNENENDPEIVTIPDTTLPTTTTTITSTTTTVTSTTTSKTTSTSYDNLKDLPHYFSPLPNLDSESRLSHLHKKCKSTFKSYRSENCKLHANHIGEKNWGIGPNVDFYTNNSFLVHPYVSIPLDCSESDSTKKPIRYYNSWIFDSTRKFAFCTPPKSGCTSVNFIYEAMKHNDTIYLEKETYYKLKNSNQIYAKMGGHRLNPQLQKVHHFFNNPEWNRVLNIRHPFEKLYSGWKDKMDLDKPYSKEGEFPKQINRARKYESENDKHKPGNMAVSFEAFLTWIVSVSEEEISDHFCPITTTCDPCEVEFDDLTQQESLTEDVVNFFYKVGTDKDKEFLDRIRDRTDFYALGKYPGSNSAKRVFTEISKLRRDLVLKVHDRFYWDFELFGYSLEGYL